MTMRKLNNKNISSDRIFGRGSSMTKKTHSSMTGGNNFMNKDIMLLDPRVSRRPPKGDNSALSSCHSRAMTRESRSHECRIESGRSMVEMLGTLAIMGVLSIGGIMGYSYAVDKYHANQIMNDVNLRGIDLIAQASRGGDFSLAEWPAKTSGDLDIGLEIDEATNTTEGGIYVKGVQMRICEIIADDLLPEEVELVIDDAAYVSGTCGETNKMVFYYDAIGEALGGKNQDCVETDAGCIPCPAGATLSADKTACDCPNGLDWDKDENECTTSCKEAMIAAGFDEGTFTVDGNTIVINGDAAGNMELTSPIDASHCDLKLAATLGGAIKLPSMKVKSFTCATEGISIRGNGPTHTILSISSGQMNLASECKYLTIGDLSLSSVDMTVREGTVIEGTTLNNVHIVSNNKNNTLTIKYSMIENSTIESDGSYLVLDSNELQNSQVDGATEDGPSINITYSTISNSSITGTASNSGLGILAQDVEILNGSTVTGKGTDGIELGNPTMDDTVTIIGNGTGTDSYGIAVNDGYIVGEEVTPTNVGSFGNILKGSGTCKIYVNGNCVW